MIKDYSQIVNHIVNEPWLITPESLQVIVDIVNMRLSGVAYTDEEIRIRMEAAENGDRDHSRLEVAGGIGVLPIYGPIFPKANLLTRLSGATSLDQVSADLNTLLNDDKVKSIVLDIDSPGGTSGMVMETGQAIRAAREVKPVYAVANTIAASAAYWLLSQATEAFSTPSGKVGSIGVYTVHEDISRQDENRGRKITIVSAGKFKVAGNPHEPLSSEAKEHMQEVTNEIYEDFIAEVAEGRKTTVEDVRENFGQGKMLTAKSAAAAGMVNGVRSLNDVLTSLLSDEKYPTTARTSLEGAMIKHKAEVDTAFRLEHAPEEHSEPGSGSPPVPRETPEEKDQTGKWRRDTPPFVPSDEEANSMNEDEIRTKLGITEDADIGEALDALISELAPLKAARLAAQQKQAFAEAYPEEAARLEKLEADSRITEAKEFAAQFENIEDTEGTKTGKGFSSLALGKVEEFQLALVEKTATVDQLSAMLKTVATNGVVDYTERGSSAEKGDRATSSNPREELAHKATEIMKNDKVSWEVALRMASEQNPELASAYKTNIPVAEGVTK